MARESRIFVEGRHDAELVEKVWGDDLRVEGVVVEYLGGVDDLVGCAAATSAPARAAASACSSTTWSRAPRRAGSPTTYAAPPWASTCWWSGTRSSTSGRGSSPSGSGLPAWPDVPRDVEWKHGVCAALGWPHADQADIARAWQQILSRVTSYADCEPALLGRVEELIDFVTDPDHGR